MMTKKDDQRMKTILERAIDRLDRRIYALSGARTILADRLTKLAGAIRPEDKMDTKPRKD